MLFRQLFVVLLALTLSSASALYAQATAQLVGLVTDNTGAAVPGVDITVTGVATNFERKVTTNDQGTYTIPFLPPGEYRLTVQKQGFQKISRENVHLEVNQTARLDFTLTVGSVTETVEVPAPSAD